MEKQLKKTYLKVRSHILRQKRKLGAGVRKHVSKVSGKNMWGGSADGGSDQRMQYRADK